MSSAQRDAVDRSLARELHDVLGVPADADEATLKRAYRAAAKLLHPDKCSLPEADAAFKRVTKAYEELLSRGPPAVATAPPVPPPASGDGGGSGAGSREGSSAATAAARTPLWVLWLAPRCRAGSTR